MLPKSPLSVDLPASISPGQHRSHAVGGYHAGYHAGRKSNGIALSLPPTSTNRTPRGLSAARLGPRGDGDGPKCST
jgi:hypothetical protein